MFRNGRTWLALVVTCTLAGGAWAQSAAELLEKGIYEEETVGDLDEAIRIYDQILKKAEAERPVVAQALLRMGQCHMKAGKETIGRSYLEELIKAYPDQADLIAQARKIIHDTPDTGPSVGPAPWEDGEILRYTLKAPSGQMAGDLTYTVQSAVVNGRDAWRVESAMGLPGPDVVKFIRVEADRDTFRPLAAIFHHTQLGRTECEYTSDERRIRMCRPGGEMEPFTQKLAGLVFDNEQAIHLIRRLPLEEGYETVLTLTGRPGLTAAAYLTVVGKETVTVPAGTYQCIKLTVGDGSRTETQWYSDDERRYPIRMVNPSVSVELNDIARLSPEATTLESARKGIAWKAPVGWDVFRSEDTSRHFDHLVQVFGPEMKVWGFLMTRAHTGDGDATDLETIARKDTDTHPGRGVGYVIRKESWKDLQVSGLPAVSYVADYVGNGWQGSPGWKMVEYRIYVRTEADLHRLVFRVQADAFDALRGEIDALVAGLKLGTG